MSKLPINVIDLLRQRTVEGKRIEYKTGWNPNAIICTPCAFTFGGGYVVIGQDCDANGQPMFPPAGLQGQPARQDSAGVAGGLPIDQPPYFPVLSIEETDGRKLTRKLQCFCRE